MITSQFHRCPALACLIVSIAVAAVVSNATASDVTYNIVDYPANEGTNTISGTIITNGTIGSLAAANIIGGTFSISEGDGELISGPAEFNNPIDLQATATALLLNPGSDSSFWISTTQSDQSWTAWADYENDPSSSLFSGGLTAEPPAILTVDLFDSYPVPTTPGSIGANSAWIIATVPEPSAFALLGIGAIGLAAFFWRRRRIL
jgi:hypothetical protein